MATIYSHPPEDGRLGVELTDHLTDVAARVEHVVPANATTPTDESLHAVVKTLGYVHDLGKATTYFQEYLLHDRHPDYEAYRHHAPIGSFAAYYALDVVDFNTELVGFLNDNGVAAHVFGWHDYYSGSVMPERGQTSGQTLVAQVNAYQDTDHRREIAALFIRGSIHNMRANVAYYDGRRGEFGPTLDRLDEVRERASEASDVPELMGVEATARKAYYDTFDRILDDEFEMGGREYNPPPNEVNSLLSFGNSLVYANCVSAIRATALDPAVSFLHEPGERRYSLSLDLADLFKPLLTDRVMFRLVNRRAAYHG